MPCLYLYLHFPVRAMMDQRSRRIVALSPPQSSDGENCMGTVAGKFTITTTLPSKKFST